VKKILLTALFILIGWSVPAWAAGMPFMYDVTPADKANIIVADRIAESLAIDPEGNALIPGSPCTTPRDYLVDLQTNHPEIGVQTVAELPAFFKVLILRKARQDGYTGPVQTSRMECAKPDTRQAGDHAVFNDPRDIREFRDDEFAWFHPNFDEPLFLGDCSNGTKGAKREVPPPPVLATTRCPIVRLEAKPGDADITYIRLGYPRPASSSCPFGYRGPGETAFRSLPTGCLSEYCTFEDILAVTGLPPGPSGKIDVLGRPGVYEFQVEAEFAESDENRYVFCLNRSVDVDARVAINPPPVFEGYRTTADWEARYATDPAYRAVYNKWWRDLNGFSRSCGIDVRSTDYHDYVATIFYQRSNIPTSWAGRPLYWGFPDLGECSDTGSARAS